MNINPINYLNGEYVSENESSIAAYDIAFVRGYAVFDFVRTYNRKPFLIEEHINRLFNSAKIANIQHDYSHAQINEIINLLIKKNDFKEYTFRIIMTGGMSSDAMGIVDNTPNLYILVKELVHPAHELYLNGVKLITDNYLRESPAVKSLNYFNLIAKRKLLYDSGAFTLLYVFNDKVLEAAICNVFIIKDNVIITPKSNILMGTTRNLIIQLMEGVYKCEERYITVRELSSADEVFITGTTQGVLPVVQIDSEIFSARTPGKVTKEIINYFNKYVDERSK